MALRQNPDGTVSVIDDVTGATLSEGVPSNLLGSLYNPGAVAPPPASDERVAGPSLLSAASVSPTGQQSPVQAPGMSDIARAFGPSITMVPGPAAAPTPEPTPSAPSAPSPQPQASAPQPFIADPTADAMRESALRAMQPRPGARVDRPAKNVLRQFQVDVTPKLDPETREELDLARELGFTRAGIRAAESGQLESAMHDDAALQYEARRQEAQRELGSIRLQERDRDRIVGARMREIDMLSEELRSKRKDARFGAEAYWEDKGALGTILAKIGMALYAGGASLTGADPMGLAKEVNKQAENYNAGKRVELELLGQELDEKHSALGEVRKQFLSRDAAESATVALMNESAAAETASLAASYKSADAQNTALALINQLQVQAAEARAQAELAEKDAVTQAWQHLEAQRGVVGGSSGGEEALLRWAKARGIPYEQAVRMVQEGQRTISPQELDIAKMQQKGEKGIGYATIEKFHAENTIQLPDGTYAYMPNQGEATRIQKVAHALPKLRNNLKRMKSIVAGVSSVDKLSPDDRAALKTLAAANGRLIKDEIGEAMTIGEYETLWANISGGNISKIFRLANEEKELDTAIGITHQFWDKEQSKLRKVPPGVDPGEPLVPPVIEEPE